MKSNHRKTRIGFTLTELLVVIAIMLTLATIGVGSFSYVQERQAREKARVQMALLSKAIEEYKLDMGRYPGDVVDTPIAGTGITAQLYTELFYEGYDYNRLSNPPATWEKTVNSVVVPKATKIYLPELDPTASKQGWVDPVTGTNSVPPDTTTIKDPWSQEYRYRKGTNAQNPDFDLWSSGKDKDTDTVNPAMIQEINKDDIRNF